MTKERMIRKAQKQVEVTCDMINIETYQVEKGYIFYAKNEKPEIIEKAFNESHYSDASGKYKLIKVTKTEEVLTEWRCMTEHDFKVLASPDAAGKDVKATIYKSAVLYKYFVASQGDIITAKEDVTFLPYRINEPEILLNPNKKLNLAIVDGHRVSEVVGIVDLTRQYGMDIGTWNLYSIPCEAPKKRMKKSDTEEDEYIYEE